MSTDVDDPAGYADTAAEAVRALIHTTRPTAGEQTEPAEQLALGVQGETIGDERAKPDPRQLALPRMRRVSSGRSAAGRRGLSEVYAVLGALVLLAGRLPQALTQLRELVADQYTAGRLRIVDGEHTGDPAAAVTDLARHLCWAASSADALRTELEQAQTTLTWAARANAD